MKQKVVVIVSGGVVQDVYLSQNEIEVEVIDCDDLEAEGNDTNQIETIVSDKIKGLVSK